MRQELEKEVGSATPSSKRRNSRDGSSKKHSEVRNRLSPPSNRLVEKARSRFQNKRQEQYEQAILDEQALGGEKPQTLREQLDKQMLREQRRITDQVWFMKCIFKRLYMPFFHHCMIVNIG